MRGSLSLIAIILCSSTALTGGLLAQVKKPVELPVSKVSLGLSKSHRHRHVKFSADGRYLFFGQTSEQSRDKFEMTAFVQVDLESQNYERVLLPKVKVQAQQLAEEKTLKPGNNPPAELRGFIPEKGIVLLTGRTKHPEHRRRSQYIFAGWNPGALAPSWSVKSDSPFFSCSLSNLGRFVVVHDYKNVRLIDTELESMTPLYSHRLRIDQIAVSADGKSVVSHANQIRSFISSSGSVETYVWNVRDDKFVRKIYVETSSGPAPGTTKNLQFVGATNLFAFTRGARLEVWATDKDKPIRVLDNVFDFVGSPTTSRIALLTRESNKYGLSIYDAESGEVIGKLPQDTLDDLKAKYPIPKKGGKRTKKGSSKGTNITGVQIRPFQLIDNGKTLVTATIHGGIKEFVLWDEDCWIK